MADLTQWEYKVAPMAIDKYMNEINKLGQEGWEGIGVNQNNALVMKRPKQPKTAQPQGNYNGYVR